MELEEERVGFGARMKDEPYFPFTNALMFERVMENEDICRGLLERILGKEIGDITYVDTEHKLTGALEAKSVFLDVFVKDEDAHYDIECQTATHDDILKRIRYYQAINDTYHLSRGADYAALKPSYIIFLCTFDPLRDGIPISTFTMQRQEAPLEGDPFEMRWMILNATSWQDESDPDLRNLLQYLKDGTVECDPLLERIDREVKAVNLDNIWKERAMGLMSLEHHWQIMNTRARNEGLAEGLAKGEAMGLAEGKTVAESRYSKLTDILLDANRIDDLKRAANDSTYLHQLYAELGI